MRSRPVLALLSCSVLALTLAGCNKAATDKPEAAAAQTEEQKTLHALGVLMSSSVQSFDFTAEEIEQVKAGLGDGLAKKAKAEDMESYVPRIQALQAERRKSASSKEKEAGVAYLAKAATEKDATKTATGIVIQTLEPGTGASPKATDEVRVHYEGRYTDGQVFDSSIERKEPASFPLNGVIPCWTEAVQTMKVGGKARIVCPSDLAYGDEGRPPQMRGGATLVFEIQLLDILKPGAAKP